MDSRKAHPALGTGRALRVFEQLSRLSPAHRETIFALAGIGPDELAKHVRSAFTVLQDAMNATKMNRLVVPGSRDVPAHVAEFTDIDHDARLAASQQMLRVVGMFPSRSVVPGQSSAPGQPVTINVHLRDMAPRMQHVAEVIDVPSNRDAIGDGMLDACGPGA